ncbi:putative ribonuclease H protein, partial [Trifolium medium]|nr:putative ribonuclease H protein [Trifolium medium]
ENEWHCFFGCISSQEVWKETEEWQHIEKHTAEANGCVAMIFEMLAELKPKIMSRIAMVMWTIWW